MKEDGHGWLLDLALDRGARYHLGLVCPSRQDSPESRLQRMVASCAANSGGQRDRLLDVRLCSLADPQHYPASTSASNAGQSRLCSRPKFVDASDIGSGDRVGERACADAEHIAAIINEPTGCFDGLLGACVPDDAIRSVFVLAVLDVPGHAIAYSCQ